MFQMQSNIESIYEQENDPNVIFAELDKGLHSLRIGEQCSAIVRYPRLFEKYPFPIMIKSSFVKLANIFRSGTNFLKLCVLQVTQQSATHLEKLGNVEEIVRCVHWVIHSNDPVARALTLKLLGSMSCIIFEDKSVHHSILHSLDSYDKVELIAALSAASSFASKSKCFAKSVCIKLSEMIERLSVPLDMKLKFILVFKNINCDAETSENIRSLCVLMLKKYPSYKFTLSILHTLTLLSARSLIHLEEQIELLFDYLQYDPRISVKLLVLKDLKYLVRMAPQVWTYKHVNALIMFLKISSFETLQNGIAQILAELSNTISVGLLCNDLDNLESPSIICCNFCCYHNNLMLSVQGVKLLSNMTIYYINNMSDKSKNSEFVQYSCSVIKVLVSVYANDESKESKHILKLCLSYVVSLCLSCPQLIDQFIDHFFALILNVEADKSVQICECISAIGLSKNASLQKVPSTLEIVLGTLVKESIGNVINITYQELYLCVIRLILQSQSMSNLNSEISFMIMNTIMDMNGWYCYKVVRQAMRYGHYKLACQILEQLVTLGSNEYQYFWLSSLLNFCMAEQLLISSNVYLLQDNPSLNFSDKMDNKSNLLEVIMKADSFYHKSIASIKAASTSIHPLSFQIDYLSLRSKMIKCFSIAIQACYSYRTSPPPAIASSLAHTTGLEKHKCEHVLLQLNTCRQMFKVLEEKYKALYRSSFDADIKTLKHLNLLIDICNTVIKLIDAINLTNCAVFEDNSENISIAGYEEQIWQKLKFKIFEMMKVAIKTVRNTPLTYQVIEVFEQSISQLTKFCSFVPRYFFQRLQNTTIKLAVSPGAKTSDDPILIKCNTELVVKVEGIVRCLGKNKPRHNFSKIQLTISQKFTSLNIKISDLKTSNANQGNKTLVETCKLQRDYFCHSFLLFFPIHGMHQAQIKASIVDKQGFVWTTDSNSILSIQAYDEAVIRHEQLQRAMVHNIAIVSNQNTSLNNNNRVLK